MSGNENPGGRGLTLELLRQIDAVIDFTTPNAVIPNIIRCAEARVPVVVGTTGWYQHIASIRELINEREAALVLGSNFSVGMNFFFKAVRAIAPILKNQYS